MKFSFELDDKELLATVQNGTLVGFIKSFKKLSANGEESAEEEVKSEEVRVTKKKETKKKTAVEDKPEEKQEASIEDWLKEPEPVEAPSPTLEEVRSALTSLVKSGKRNEVISLLQKYGAATLQDVKPTAYAAIMADAEALK